MTKTCTTRMLFEPGGVCGKPAIYEEGEFAECAECAEHPASLYATRKYANGGAGRPAAVGDAVEVRRHGKVYVGKVVYVGARGAVKAEVTYGNGATRTVRV